MSIATAPPLIANQRSELIFPLAVMALLGVLIVPLPTAVLDVLLTLSLSSTILLLLVTLGVGSPLELSVFPSALLLLTLARLSLNVATTRLILSQANAGQLVEAFGNFVVGGNLVVGLVVFLILVIIQFVVITKGATRISEISARFVLDAMPGRQMRSTQIAMRMRSMMSKPNGDEPRCCKRPSSLVRWTVRVSLCAAMP